MAKLTKTIMAKTVLDHMRFHYKNVWGLRIEEFDAFASANLWFLTFLPGLEEGDEQAFKHYRISHYAFLKLMFGSKPGRHRNLQPMGYAFLDHEGTRRGRGSRAKLLPHIHALMMIHPLTRPHFDTIPKEGTIFAGAKLYDPNDKGMQHVASYAMKGAVNGRGFLGDEDATAWEIYPRTISKTDPAFKRTARIKTSKSKTPTPGQ